MMKIGFACDLGVDGQRIQDFYRDHWPRKIALSDRRFYEWQFVRPPANAGKDHCVVAFDPDAGEIGGVMGLNKRCFVLEGQELNGAELTTWIVSPSHQGAGLGGKIMKHIQEHLDVCIGMGISEMALPIYMRSGFRYLRAIPRFVKVIHFERIKAHVQCGRLGERLAQMWTPKAQPNKTYSARPCNGADYLSLYDRMATKVNHFSRTVEDLAWRYEDHPYFQYKQFLIEPNDGGAGEAVYVAMREECSLAEFRVLHVTDLLGEGAGLSQAVAFLNDYALEHDFDVIDFYCPSGSIYRQLLADGWFSINDDDFQFPHLFHPVELRTPPTTSLIYWARDRMAAMADLSRLYVTKQDADLDRPTGHSLEAANG